jgi:hypothetical protein
MKGVVGIVRKLERRARAEACDHRPQEIERCEGVVRSLQEQHRQIDFGKVRGALVRGLAGRV